MGTIWDETCAAGEAAREERRREYARMELERERREHEAWLKAQENKRESGQDTPT